jgi:phage gp45-like
VIRGIVKWVKEGFIKLFSATGRTDESFEQREYFQHYGFTSRPLEGAEIIIIREGNHFLAIASDDRRYRIAMKNGEMAIYTDEGDWIHLKRGNNIHVNCKNKLTADVTNEVLVNTKKAVVNATDEVDINTKVATIDATTSCTVTSPVCTVNAATSVTITSPAVNVNCTNATVTASANASVTAATKVSVTAPEITLNASSALQLFGGSFVSATYAGGPSRALCDSRLNAWIGNHTHGGGPTPDQGTPAYVTGYLKGG